MIRKLFMLGVATAAAALLIPAASASAYSNCGDYWTYLPIGDGGNAKVVENITSTNVPCSDARPFVRRAWNKGLPYRSGAYTAPGWKTYYARYRTYDDGWRADIRLTRGNKVIRFQSYTDYC